MIEIPESLPYPKIMTLSEVPQIKDKLCYIINGYQSSGVGMLVVRKDDNVCIRLSDFAGNIIDVNESKSDIINTIMCSYSHRLVFLLKCIDLKQALFYFVSDLDKPILVDVRLSINKFCSPGYINDFISRQGIPCQEIIGKPILLTDEICNNLRSKSGIYTSGKFIIKPSVFKFIEKDRQFIPMYAGVGYEAENIT